MARFAYCLTLCCPAWPTGAQTGLTPDQIRVVLQALADDGYDPGPADGGWTQGSAAALQRYQVDWQLPLTGELAASDRYDGEWRSGQANGYGTYYGTDGSVKSGFWASGCLSDADDWITVGATSDECKY